MPNYLYKCPKCETKIEVSFTFEEYDKYKDNVNCKCGELAHRDFQSENIYHADSPITVGSLADKNSNKISADEQTYIGYKNTEYMRTPWQGGLPEGAKLTRKRK